jgi:PAS domain S-box-containing protein
MTTTDREVTRLCAELERQTAGLQKSQSLLAQAEKMGKVGGWEFDLDTKQQIWTEGVYRIHEVDLTYSPNVENGINFYTPASRPIIERAVQRAIEHAEPFDVELEITTAKGNLRKVHAIGMADPAHRRVFGFFQDITERKQAEEAVENSEMKLRAVVDATPFPIAIVDVEDNNIVYWSRSALTLFGHTAPTASEWYQLAYPDPEYRREVVDSWKPLLEKAKLSGQAVNTGEYRITCSDGSVRICELFATFLSDNLIVTFSDITERKRAEEAVLLSEQQLKSYLDNAGDAIYVIEAKTGRIRNCNARACLDLGYTREELLELSTKDIEAKLTPGEINAIHRDQMSGVVKTIDGTHKRKDGSIFPVEIRVSSLAPAQPKLLLAIARDITERKSAEEKIMHQLEELQHWQEVTLGREDRIRQLKSEVNQLLVQQGEPTRYRSAESANT